MVSIIKAEVKDYKTIADIGLQTFLESHGNSASAADIENYTNQKYSYEQVKQELADPKNIFHLLIYKDDIRGKTKNIQ
jgi:diamine N-acetyltransferase